MNEIAQDASTVGNALKTISMRIRAMDEETGEFDDTLQTISGDIYELTHGQVSIMQDANTYKDIYTILDDISKVWDSLTDKEHATLTETLFGKHRANIGSAIISNFEQARKAIETMENADGGAMAEMEVIMDSISYRANIFKETLVGIAQSSFSQDFLKSIVDSGTRVLNVFDDLSPSISFILEKFAALLELVTKLADTIGGIPLLIAGIGLKSIGNIKTWLYELKEVQMAINGISALSTSFNGGTNMFVDTAVVTQYANQLRGLSVQQVELALSTKLLTAEQKKQIMVELGLVASENQVQANLVKTALTQAGVNAETQNAILKELELINVTTNEIIVNNTCTESALKRSMATHSLSKSQQEAVATTLAFSNASNSASVSTNLMMKSVGNSFKTLFSNLLSFIKSPLGIVSAVAVVIGSLAFAYDKVAQSVENTRNKVKELKSEFDGQVTTANNNAKRIEEIIDKYDKLSDGVNQLGENISLTNDEYAEYNSLTNEIADMFPTLVQGYTDEGNAIINLKGNVESLRDAYIEARKEAYNLLIVTGEDDKGKDIMKQWEDLNDTNWFLKAFDLGAQDVDKGISKVDAVKQLEAVMKMTADEYRQIARSITTVEMDNLSDLEIAIGEGSYLNKAIGLKWNITDDEFAKARQQAKTLVQTYNAEIDTALSNIKDIATAYLMTNDDYDKLNGQAKNAVSIFINSIDAEMANKFNGEKKNIGNYVTNILSAVSSDTNVRDAIVKLYTMDDKSMSAKEIINNVDSYIGIIASALGENSDELKNRLGFGNVGEELSRAVVKFGSTKKSLLEQLTNEQLEIAIQIPDLFSNGSFDGTLKSITDRIEAWNKANGNLEIKFNYAEYSEQVDDVVKNIDKLQSALDNLTSGKSLEIKDITELANSFPDYSTKILSAANSTEELKLVLTDIKRNAPKSLINTLENLSGLSKQDQEAVNGLISVLTTVNSKTSTYADTLADLETKESLLSSVYKEMHDDGQISISTYQKLIEMGDDYANMVTVVNGKITVNTQDLKELTKKKYEDEIATLKLTKAELGYNIASNPQNYSLYAEKMSAIDADIEAKEQALELLNGFDYTDDDKKESDDPWKDKAETEIAKIQHLEAMNKITHEQYIDELDKINQKYYANNEKYLTEFNKYDEEVFKGRRELAEKAFDDTIDGIEKEIDALDKLKDNASLDINAEGSIYSIIDQQILLYQQAIAEIDKRIAELEASGLVGIEDEIEELNKQKDDLLEKVYDLGKERTSTGIENEISYWEEMQSKQNDFYDKQIEKLKKQKELLEDKNDEEERAKDLAEKQLELRKAEIALEDARRNRNVLVYTAGGGYSYEADQTAIAEAEADVKKAKEDLEELRQEEIKDNLDKQIEILEEQKDKDSEYYDTIIKLLEDMSGKNKVQSESNRSVWGELLATEAGQKALAQIDPDKLQELLDSGFLVQKDGKYSLGEKKPNDEKANEVFKAGADVISMLSKLLHKSESEIKSNDKLMNAVTSGGFNSLAMPSQSTLSELTKTKGTMVTNYNNSKINNTYHVDKIDIGYSGDDFNGMLEQAFNAMNQGITINGNKVAYGN